MKGCIMENVGFRQGKISGYLCHCCFNLNILSTKCKTKMLDYSFKGKMKQIQGVPEAHGASKR